MSAEKEHQRMPFEEMTAKTSELADEITRAFFAKIGGDVEGGKTELNGETSSIGISAAVTLIGRIVREAPPRWASRAILEAIHVLTEVVVDGDVHLAGRQETGH